MSDLSGWTHEAFAGAEAVPVWTRPQPRHFSPTGTGSRVAGFSAWASEPAAPAPTASAAPASVDMEAMQAEAYALGFNEGHQAALAAMEGENASADRLATALANVRAEPPAGLAQILAETVSRLVRQVVGEVEIDAALMGERCMAVAAMVSEEGTPARLRLNPHDAARIEGVRPDLVIVPDPSLAEGSVVAETASGWIEDGPAIRMEKLRALLDQLGCRR